LLSGSSGGIFSSQPEGVSLNPKTGAITPGTSAAGSYVVKYTLEKPGGSNLLEASTGIAIYSSVIPKIVIKWEDVLICSNVDDMFVGYQWFIGTTPIPGANNQYYVSSKTPGIYVVEAIDKNGCKNKSNEINVGGASSLLLYPNPATNSFKISINDTPIGKARISVINASGKEVINLSTEKSEFEFSEEISTSNLDRGFYLIKVIVNEVNLYTLKIMVIK
jgi:trimeric autotransporter adhesin